MGFWNWLGVGKNRAEPTFDTAFSDEQKVAIRKLALPAIRLEAGGEGFSRLGGLPDMPQGEAWPRDQAGKPLSFLAQIEMAALPPVARQIGLPERGHLWFFYDQRQGGSGFDPKNKTGWKVLYSELGQNEFEPCLAPAGLKVYSAIPVVFRAIDTYPTDDGVLDMGAKLDFSDSQMDVYIDFAATGSNEAHMVGGHNYSIQGSDMPLICQLASNGIYCGDSKAYKTPEAKALSSGAKDWRLLLQLAPDKKSKMMWGDNGMLYFWIREYDLKACRFDKVWMLADCY